ncbi:MAG: hypothetical protein UY65_C0002G0005 [Parcubacteria group bacterium GW2011_GWA2_51_12]|nr:MAG: hypothetical protein UY65_C0002G0005 [Parcubacteria group bacterium GW2011_GWA2_51_12]
MTRFIINIIELYQRWLSPDHSFWAKTKFPNGYCRYYPSCSEYARQAVLRYGVIKGSGKALWRVLRCNPFSRFGIDEIKQTP